MISQFAPVLRRILLSALLMFVATILTFVLATLVPGDAARAILGQSATDAQVDALRDQLGLNLPLQEQYVNWLSAAVHGDLGVSLSTGGSVSDAIRDRLPVTLSLIGLSLLLSVGLGVGLGIFSAVRGGPAGRLVDTLGWLGFALPSFWVGALLVAVFAVGLAWLPASGYVEMAVSPSAWLRSLILPSVALAIGSVAAVSQQTREAMLDELRSEHVRISRANGIRERSIIFRHCLKNAGIRITTVVGLQVIGLLGGTVLVENLFALPGLGSLAVSAVLRGDLPTIQGVVVVFTAVVIVINLAVDLSYSILNPRIRK